MATFCQDSQVNSYLDGSKVVYTSGMTGDPAKEAENLIRGHLAGHIDSVTMAAWTAYGSTPALVGTIQALFIASILYGKLYSEDNSKEVSAYAIYLYNKAMSYLTGIVAGSYDLWDLSPTAVVTGLDNLTTDMFFPNDEAVLADPNQGQFFKQGQRF